MCPKFDLKEITKCINIQVPIKQRIFEKMEDIEDKFLSSLRKIKSRLAEEIRFAGLEEESRRTAEEIFCRKNARCLRGKEAA